MANSIEWERKSVGKTTRKKQESSANQALILSRTIVKPFFTSLHYSPHRERIEIGCIEYGGLSQMAQFFFTSSGLPFSYKFQATLGCLLDAVWWFRRPKVIVNATQLYFGVSVSVETALRCFGIFPDYLRRGQLLIPSLLHM